MKERRTSLLWLILIACLAVGLIWKVAKADNGRYDDDVSVDTTITSDSVVSTTTRAFSLSGSDMEIRDCLATYSFLFGIWQNVKMDPLCEAVRLQSQGNYQAAAEMRCSTRKYRKVYGSGQDCIDAVILNPPSELEPPIIEDDEDEVRHLAQQEEIEYLQEEQASLVGRIDELTERLEQAPVRNAQQQQPQYSDEQVNAVWAALKGEVKDE